MNIEQMREQAVATIYLIPGEYNGESCMVWVDDPAPGEDCDESEAVEYVRKDVYEARIAQLEAECAAHKAAEEKQIALRQKADERVAALAADRDDLIVELTACQNMLHGLAHSGGCSPDYPNDAKKVLERVTGGHAPSFEDSGPKGKCLARRYALKQAEALTELVDQWGSECGCEADPFNQGWDAALKRAKGHRDHYLRMAEGDYDSPA